jgi:hypothetical protein
LFSGSGIQDALEAAAVQSESAGRRSMSRDGGTVTS